MEGMSEMNRKIRIRAEKHDDYKNIHTVVEEAFGKEGQNVAELVTLIRNSDNYIPELSFVAEVKGKIVGHIMLSHLNLQDENGLHQVVTLSPLAVAPKMQKKGVGSALIEVAIKKADEFLEPMIVLEGSPAFYSRFGFKPAVSIGVTIDLPHWAPEEAAMVYPLSAYKAEIKGKVAYPPAFDKVNEASHARSERIDRNVSS
jgi:putative acetyltransferase